MAYITTWGEVRQIASGCQEAGGALSRRIIFFSLQLNFERRKQVKRTNKTRMWDDAQCDGYPDEYRWRPLPNAAMFGCGWSVPWCYHSRCLKYCSSGNIDARQPSVYMTAGPRPILLLLLLAGSLPAGQYAAALLLYS